jgi:hypothetical protein
VIVPKLEYYREGGSGKHLKDIRGMLAEPHSSTIAGTDPFPLSLSQVQ